MKQFLVLFALIICMLPATHYAQRNDVDFLTKKIQNNYAGYFDKTTDEKFGKYIHKVISEERTDTFKILSRIINYFEDQHMLLYAMDVIQNSKIDTQLCKANISNIESDFLGNKDKLDSLEGFWINDQLSNVIAIKKGSKGHYNGYLVESRNSKVPFGFKIAEIEYDFNGRLFTNYIAPRTGIRVLLRSQFVGDSILITGDIAKWKKLDLHSERPFLTTTKLAQPKTTGILLDSDSYLLTIPDFRAPSDEIVDSIVKADYSKIVSAKNLIIDLRDNTGGTVRTYEPLMQFIYTKPIVSVAGYTRCTDDLIAHRKEGLENYLKREKIDSSVLKSIIADIKKAEDNKGTFFFEPGDTTKYDSVLLSPQNVAIITNYACESAVEMMLLECKQSSKVTTFGEHTMGAVDYLNTYPIETPSEKYVFSMATVKRYIPVGQKKIDGVGIYPDVPIHLSNKDWITYVERYYATKKKK